MNLINKKIIFFICSEKFTKLIFITSLICFLFFFNNTPITLWVDAGHDDGLFYKLAKNISNLKWLGDFNNLTLAKGAGLPLLLAFIYWFKIPYLFALSLILILGAYILRKNLIILTKSFYISTFIPIFVLWYPGFDYSRIVRDPFYTSLCLLVVSLIIYLFNRNYKNFYSKNYYIVFLLLGLIKIVREDAVVFYMPVLLLVLVKLYYSKDFCLTIKLKKFVNGFIIFFAPTFLVILLNIFTYNTYTINDFSEKNFTQSLKYMFSFDDNDIRARKSNSLFLPKQIREKIYPNSKHFNELYNYLDKEEAPLIGWQQASCSVFPDTCGDYGGPWFIWAFRDAVQAAGYYKNPNLATNYFKDLNKEFEWICKTW